MTPRALRWACACAVAMGCTAAPVPAAAALRLSAPAEHAAGVRLPLAVSGAPAGAHVALERRDAPGWRVLTALVADAHGAASASLRTRVAPARRLRFRAALADGTTVSPAVAVRLRYVTLRAVGDINLGDGPGKVMAARGPRWPWIAVAPLLRRADIAFGNLECSVSSRGAPVPKQFNFRGRPSYLSTVAGFAGMDVLNLANNHVGDYGPLATADTIRRVRHAGMLAAGAGLNAADAARPRIIRRLGLKVAFVGFSDIQPVSFAASRHRPGTRWATPDHIAHDVHAARRRADVVIASFHWGIERDTHTSARQRMLARMALRAGATAVIAAHPHVLQPVVRPSRHRLIAYSLGNFVWSAGGGLTARTGVLTVRLSPRGIESSSLRHAQIIGTRPTPTAQGRLSTVRRVHRARGPAQDTAPLPTAS
jgi:poly-gamma-glutamate capsule biosynthesis protein CapA/YwtB (metallophosphatase superfamily)